MPESESEDEILDRVEVALLKIAARTQQPRPAVRTPDRLALAHALDTLIDTLHAGLEQRASAEHRE